MAKQKNLKTIKNDVIIELLGKYGITPKNENLWMYIHALTHSSYRHEANLHYDYERLEFLGDAALQWVVTNYVFSKYQNESEGKMTHYRSGLVCKKSLVRASDILGLSKIALFGNGITEISDNIKEDLFESFLGAIAQDVGIKKVSSIINQLIIIPFENNDFKLQRHYKTEIQELVAPINVKYRVVVNEKDYALCEILINGIVYGSGEGKCQREAEENAAKNAYEKYQQPTR